MGKWRSVTPTPHRPLETTAINLATDELKFPRNYPCQRPDLPVGTRKSIGKYGQNGYGPKDLFSAHGVVGGYYDLGTEFDPALHDGMDQSRPSTCDPSKGTTRH